ncbi:MAG TPA: nuclear transport factor 2 family protein, partial [Kofleriaceae bacterium]|nr:nuclear transport factor 2 family protein [Kofleriaceae bacterium]
MKRPALALALLAATACGKNKGKDDEDRHDPPLASADAAAPGAPDAAPAATADPGARFQECLAAFNGRKLDALRGCYTADAIGVLADSPPELKGVDEILAANQSFWKAYPDIKSEPQVILVSGNKVAALVLTHGTNSGALEVPGGEAPPTNRAAGTLGIVVSEFDGSGHARSETQYLDARQIMLQIAGAPGARKPMLTGAAEPT